MNSLLKNLVNALIIVVVNISVSTQGDQHVVMNGYSMIYCRGVKSFYRAMQTNEKIIKRKINYNLNRSRRSVFEGYVVDANVAQELEKYRSYHGTRLDWWGDLNARDTRSFYHKLIDDGCLALRGEHITESNLYDVACRCVEGRIVSKLYSRERATVPVLLMSLIIDFISSMSRENPCMNELDDKDRIWNKYCVELGLSPSKVAENPGAYPELCRLVILKSTTTNKSVNKLLIKTKDCIF